MQLKKLVYKEHSHHTLSDILKKYSNAQNFEGVSFTLDELKSILSLLFSVKYHFTQSNDQTNTLNEIIIAENNHLINSTRHFGRQMIENLNPTETEWLNSLLNEKYDLLKVFRYSDLINFTEMALLDYMNYRNFEFGDFFMKRFTLEVFDYTRYNFYQNHIQSALQNEKSPLITIGAQIEKASNNRLYTFEKLVLTLMLKENLLYQKCNSIEYGLVSYIAKEQMLNLASKKNTYKEIITNCLSQRWGINRGRRGPRL